MTLLEQEQLVPRFSESSFQTIEEYATSLKGLDTEEYQLSRGEFNGNSHVVCSDSFRLGFRAAKADHLQLGYLKENYVGMVFPLKNLNYVFNGKNMQQNQQIIGCGNRESKIFFPKGHEHYTLLIDTNKMSQYFDSGEYEKFIASCENFSEKKICTDRKMAITHNIHDIFKNFKYLLEHPCSLLAFQDCYDSLFYSINEYYTTEPCTLTEKISNRERLLARALDFIHHADIESLSISGLIKGTHASSRSLQYCFSELLGLTPKSYLIKLRLNAIRKDLLLADPGETTITAIAHKYGVVNIGRFKQDYQAFFNETPRETIKQTRTSP